MTTMGHIFKNQIVAAPDASGYASSLALTFTRERSGWVRVECKRAEWSYNTREARWSHGLAPTADAELLAQIVAAAQQEG